MDKQNNTFSHEAKAVERLTALWAFTESGIGGFLHAFHLPFSGLLVGGLSILWISLIARFSATPSKSILQAGIIVLVLKGVLAPQSPPGAYFALSIQMTLGALFFIGNRNFAIKAYVLSVLTILFSAFQKIIILTLLFGQPLWDSINSFGAQTAAQLSPYFPGISLSEFFITLFIGVYLLGGLIIGKYIHDLMNYEFQVRWVPIDQEAILKPKKQNARRMPLTFLIATALLIVAVQGFWLNQWTTAFSSLFRALLVLAFWFLLLLPLLRLAARRKSGQWKQLYQKQIDSVQSLIPTVALLLKQARKTAKSEKKKGFRALFILWLEYVLSYEKEHPSSNG